MGKICLSWKRRWFHSRSMCESITLHLYNVGGCDVSNLAKHILRSAQMKN
jgi:hypothetical protein